MKSVTTALFMLSFCMTGVFVPPLNSQATGDMVEVGRFSAARAGQSLPDGWTPLTFHKIHRHTEYSLVRDGETVVVKASSKASASGLVTAVRIDPKEYSIVRWRWKIDNLLEKSNVRRKTGDDYPARLYITFEYEPDKVGWAKTLKYQAGRVLFGAIPIAAINYIWDGTTPAGSILDNAYTDFAKMIVIRTGSERVGQWVDETRNIYDDYRLAFGEEPPMINGVAIMTDTDNTQEAAIAYYGDIVFQRPSTSPAGK
jgi:hypothetical protein